MLLKTINNFGEYICGKCGNNDIVHNGIKGKCRCGEVGKLENFESFNPLFSQSLKRIKKPRLMNKFQVLGFDTEYDSKTKELLSVQLSYKGNTLFEKIDKGFELTWEYLFKLVKDFIKDCGGNVGKDKVSCFLLISFFSIAEVQHLPYKKEGVRYSEYGSGNYDFTFPVSILKTFRCPSCRTRKKPVKSKDYGICKKCQTKREYKDFKNNKTLQTLRVVDFQVWFRGQSLFKVAETFGLKKIDSIDRTKINRSIIDTKEFREYAVNDAIICEEGFLKLRKILLDEFNIDIINSRTPANTSMCIFRKNYLKSNYGNENIELRRLVLQSSWGGNNQAFKRGIFKGEFFEYDAVSMYPNSAIALKVLPTDNDWKKAKNLYSFLDEKNIGGVCHIKFKFKKGTNYPCLPVMEKGKLIYPLEGISFCTLHEVRFAKELGCDLELKKGYFYNSGVNDLQRYLKVMLEKKDQAGVSGDIVKRTLWKLMINAIIGKFTQKLKKIDLNSMKKIADKLEIKIDDLFKIKNLSEYGIKKSINLGSGFYPEWNCLILGYARAVLAKAFYQNHAYLGTTDSLIIDKSMKNETIDGIKFNLETKGDKLIIVRTRFYLLENEKEKRIEHMAMHGVKNYRKAIQILKNISGNVKIDRSKLMKEVKELKEEFRVLKKELKYIKDTERGLLKAIKELGGIKPNKVFPDLKFINREYPGILKKTGQGIDEIIAELSYYGFTFIDGDDLYETLKDKRINNLENNLSSYYEKELYTLDNEIQAKADLLKEKNLDLEVFSFEDVIKYKSRKIYKLRESMKEGKKLGFEKEINVSVSLAWDNKRKLLKNGDSIPL